MVSQAQGLPKKFTVKHTPPFRPLDIPVTIKFFRSVRVIASNSHRRPIAPSPRCFSNSSTIPESFPVVYTFPSIPNLQSLTMPSGHVDNAIGIANLPNQRHKIVAKRYGGQAAALEVERSRMEREC